MPQNSIPSYLIAGEQTDWNVVASSMIQTVYQFRQHSLQKQSSPVTLDRFHRNPSPLKNMQGFITAGGGLSMDLHAEDMLVWFQHWLQDSSISSVDAAPQDVFPTATYTNPDSLTTQPTGTSPATDPGKLIVTFSVAKTGTLTITGTDQNDTAITETLTFSADTTQTTTKYFRTVDTNGLVFSGISGDNMTIQCDPNTYTHTIALGDTVMDGLTLEVVKGGIPNTFIGCLINEATLELGEALGLSMTLLAKTANLRENISGGSSPTSVAAYSDMSEEVYPGWGYAVQVDSVQHAIETASIRLSNMLDYPERKQASRYRTQPHQTGNRSFGLEFTCDYDTTNEDFDTRFDAGDVVAVTIAGVHMPYAGPEYSFTFTFPRCQLLAYSDPAVGTKGNLLQSVTLHPIRSVGASSSDEMSLQIVSTESGV